MKIYDNPPRSSWSPICGRPAQDPDALQAVIGGIFEEVGKDGDDALIRYTERFDKVVLDGLEYMPARSGAQAGPIPEKLRQAIDTAYGNIRRFHQAQTAGLRGTAVDTMPGVSCWREPRPISSVGLYVPGGSAPLFSTVLMLGIPAQLAGCDEIILCTPPGPDGSIDPAISYAAGLTGVTRIFRVGGAQAIAAMALGTASIPKTEKIFGPGNQYVTAAKQYAMRFGTAIDMPAGPSEVMVIADGSSRPDFVAADLLSQAEHGPDSQVVLVCLADESLAGRISSAMDERLKNLPRRTIAEKALANSFCVLLRDRQEALDFANEYAPEHLILSIARPREAARRVRNAGSVFLGNYSPESAGDYASGTNHTLPTAGWARTYGGVSLESFFKYVTFQSITKAGAKALAPSVMAMAEAEGLEAHRQAMKARL